MTQTIEYVVKVAGTAPAAAQVKTVEDALQRTTVAATNAGSKLDGVTKGAKDLAARMGPAAAAISSVSASLGAAGGAAGKMVAAGGQIAAAFGAGGPIGAAIVAGTVAVDAFSASLLKVEAAREAAFERNFDKQYGNILRMAKATQNLNLQVAALDMDLMYVGVEADDRATLLRQEEAIKLREQANKLDNQAGDARRVMAWSERERLRGEAKALELQATVLDRIVDRTIALKRARDDLKPPTRAGGRAATPSDAVEAMFDETSFSNTDAQIEADKRDAIDRVRDETAKRERARLDAVEADAKAHLQRIADNEEMFRNMTYEQEREAYQRRAMLAQEHANVITGLTINTAAILADGIAGAAMGQEAAVEQTLAALSRQAGGFITLEGGKLLASGIAGTLIAPGNPASLAQLAGGAALVAAGAAVTSGGPAVVSSLMGKTGGGSAPSGAGRDPGASPRSSGGGSGGGPMIINVSYGAGGPLPEDIAREIHSVMRSGDRRSGR